MRIFYRILRTQLGDREFNISVAYYYIEKANYYNIQITKSYLFRRQFNLVEKEKKYTIQYILAVELLAKLRYQLC